MQVEQELVDAGAEIIWVLEQNPSGQIGLPADCRSYMDGKGSLGWCVGDGETQPMSGTFDNSPFSIARGFDMIVIRETMQIAYTTAHGTTSGNDNISGEELLEIVRDVVDQL